MVFLCFCMLMEIFLLFGTGTSLLSRKHGVYDRTGWEGAFGCTFVIIAARRGHAYTTAVARLIPCVAVAVLIWIRVSRVSVSCLSPDCWVFLAPSGFIFRRSAAASHPLPHNHSFLFFCILFWSLYESAKRAFSTDCVFLWLCA
ncbi:hypothetical protein BO79DRAFT_78908 [Aspergillus costaricaensis CBS 115574]|uniref:Uncharacterized protein n=1 Tax=Aspergillus costaricaensis CBS 115574 TaxID=1448317 RepID=A0ACD1IKZ7_9EURO|nr:hypothetical protein BO79DRAFT_78908 [Aspergillus costaricaensis CBS 115574]RAK91074.1 hypothetical protein BO79DRAFT_78908 [Aspergillus costaricaensis CBS 115574]